MKIKCVNRWLVVKPNPSNKRTGGGVIIPDTAQERNPTGTVLEIADAWMNSDGDTFPTVIAKGEEVMYDTNRGTPVIQKDILEAYDIGDGEELLMLMYDDLKFVTKENKEGQRKRKLYKEKYAL